MEQAKSKTLKIITTNTNFIGRVATTIRNILVPTKIGMNSFLISMKRRAYIKADRLLERIKEVPSKTQREEAERKYNIAYEEYLEAVDKYIMDSIYAKVRTDKASKVEKKALADYYKINTNKSEQYEEYKNKKQLFLLSLDYKVLKSSGKRIDDKYEELYAEKQTKIYRNLLKNYSVRLADNRLISSEKKNTIYMEIFRSLSEYVKEILPLEMKHSKVNKYSKIQPEIDKYNSYLGKLDEKDNLERTIILLNLSRTLFTHSLPMPVIEECFDKLLRDTRTLLMNTANGKKDKVFGMIRTIIVELHQNVLGTKIYWENKEEKKAQTEFWKKYQEATTEEEKNIQIAIKEIKDLTKDKKIKERKLRAFYYNRLKELGLNPILGYTKSKTKECMRYTRYVEAV